MGNSGWFPIFFVSHNCCPHCYRSSWVGQPMEAEWGEGCILSMPTCHVKFRKYSQRRWHFDDADLGCGLRRCRILKKKKAKRGTHSSFRSFSIWTSNRISPRMLIAMRHLSFLYSASGRGGMHQGGGSGAVESLWKCCSRRLTQQNSATECLMGEKVLRAKQALLRRARRHWLRRWARVQVRSIP